MAEIRIWCEWNFTIVKAFRAQISQLNPVSPADDLETRFGLHARGMRTGRPEPLAANTARSIFMPFSFCGRSQL
jgi:hypothetical protein